jgi:hypothetical protein
MKRLSLIAMLLLGGTLNARADNDIYGNITKHPRGGHPHMKTPGGWNGPSRRAPKSRL